MAVIGLLVIVILLQLAIYGELTKQQRQPAPNPVAPRPVSVEAVEAAATTILAGAAEELRAASVALTEAAANLKDEPGKGYRASRAHVAAKRALAAAQEIRR
jgi:hypothetical protein